MPETDKRSDRPLSIDPMPRRALELPPMIETPSSFGMASTPPPDESSPEIDESIKDILKDILAELDFKSSR